MSNAPNALSILGMNFWGRAKAVIDFDQRLVRVGSEVVPLTPPVGSTIAAISMSMHNP